MIGHLSGPRVSALLDGQLSARESDEAWAHVYACHPCRDLVEREGWVKTRLAGLCGEGEAATPSSLKGSLLSMPPPRPAAPERTGRERRPTPALLVGGGALGAAFLGVVALGVAPGAGPELDRAPVTQIGSVVPGAPSRTTPPTPFGPVVAPPTPPSGANKLIALLRTPLEQGR